MALETFTFKDFRGLNKLSDRLNMSPEFAWDIRNAYIKKDANSGLGVIKQRSGITKFNSVSFTTDCKDIYEPKWDAGGTDIIIKTGTTWKKYDGVNTFANLDTGRPDSRGMAAMFGNELILVDGGIPRKVTAAYAVSNLSVDAAMPQDSTAVHVHQHKVWLNSPTYPMKAYYSKTDSANAADSWSASGDAGSLDFSRILPYGDTLLGFKTFSQAYLVFIFMKHVVVYNCGTTPSEFAIQQIIPLNCISAHGISIIGDDLAVCSLEGVNSFKSSQSHHELDTDDLTKLISPYYRELLSQLSDKSVVSSEFSHKLNHMYVGLPITNGHIILVYSIDIGNFVGIFEGYNCFSFCERRNGVMLIGSTGYVYTMNLGTDDDGTAIDFIYTLPFLYFGDADKNKALKQIEGIIKHESTQSSFPLNIDYWYGIANSSSGSLTETINLSAISSLWRVALYRSGYYRASVNTRFLTSNLKGRGKQVALSIYHSVANANIEIPYLTVRLNREGDKIR